VWTVFPSIHLNLSKGTKITANHLVPCVRSERERERDTAWKDAAIVVARWWLYPPEITERFD
jgi:hypothetical protein